MAPTFITVMVIGWLIAQGSKDLSMLQLVGSWMFFFGLVSTLVWIVH